MVSDVARFDGVYPSQGQDDAGYASDTSRAGMHFGSENGQLEGDSRNDYGNPQTYTEWLEQGSGNFAK